MANYDPMTNMNSEYAKAFSEAETSEDIASLVLELLSGLGLREAAWAAHAAILDLECQDQENEEAPEVPEPAYTPAGFAAEMQQCAHQGTEEGHVAADWLLCELLESLGYGEGIDIFEKMHKWYS